MGAVRHQQMNWVRTFAIGTTGVDYHPAPNVRDDREAPLCGKGTAEFWYIRHSGKAECV
jgi:hypothetical protein